MSTVRFAAARRRCLMAFGAFAAVGRLAARPALPAPAGLTLARVAPADIDPSGWLVSEKFDGVRAVWDGRVLRFRSGRTVPAPAAFLGALPRTPLDGELWLGRGRFDQTAALLRRIDAAAADWAALQYLVFELPGGGGGFAERHARLGEIVAAAGMPGLRRVAQEPVADRAALRRRLDAVLRTGGEGLMLHRADAPYAVGRSDVLLKLKPVQDEDAVVLGHVAGRGRHAGRLGALRVRNDAGVVFLLGSGFSDAQREAPPPVGSVVTYACRGLTPSGVPRFASFLRVRDEG